MWTALTLHPDSRCDAVKSIEVEAVRGDDGVLRLRYRLTGDMGGVCLPAAAEPAFADGLWRETCLEAFVRGDGQADYFELNISPSRQWAAYHLDGYREGMTPASDVPAPEIETQRGAKVFGLAARVDLGRGAGIGGASWRLGLSAVIQETDGAISYWALRHPQGKPDFHHPDCFALELPAREQP